jgi:hypothetical protein
MQAFYTLNVQYLIVTSLEPGKRSRYSDGLENRGVGVRAPVG